MAHMGVESEALRMKVQAPLPLLKQTATVLTITIELLKILFLSLMGDGGISMKAPMTPTTDPSTTSPTTCPRALGTTSLTMDQTILTQVPCVVVRIIRGVGPGLGLGLLRQESPRAYKSCCLLWATYGWYRGK